MSLLFAAAPGWTATFPAPVVASYLEGSDRAVLVAAMGEPAHAAAQAVLAALRDSGRTRFAMDEASLGDVSALSDPELVGRAAAAPVDLIATVRVFPGGRDEPPVAVVTLYDKRGRVTAAFTGIEGRPIPPRASPGVTSGVSPNAMATVNEIGKEHAPRPPPPPSPQALYDDRYLWLRKSGSSWEPMQGRIGRELEVDAFFLRMGRQDLVDQVRGRRTLRLWLWIGGSVVLTAGAITALAANAGANCARVDSSSGSCLATDNNLLASGLVIGAAGLVAFVSAFMLDANPVPLSDAQPLADDFNRKLGRELGVTRADAAPVQLRWALNSVELRW